MKAENGACPYGEYNHLVKNETSTGKGACRVYQFSDGKIGQDTTDDYDETIDSEY